jgi:hypothetical protein
VICERGLFQHALIISRPSQSTLDVAWQPGAARYVDADADTDGECTTLEPDGCGDEPNLCKQRHRKSCMLSSNLDALVSRSDCNRTSKDVGMDVSMASACACLCVCTRAVEMVYASSSVV